MVKVIGAMEIGSTTFKERQNTIELDPLSTADVYYGQSHKYKAGARVRTYSTVCASQRSYWNYIVDQKCSDSIHLR